MTPRFSLPTVAPEGFAALSRLEEYGRAAVDPVVLHLVKIRASILNGCAFCLDMHATEALADGADPRRLTALAAWRETPFFDERERAALALTDAVTKLGDDGVPDDVWDEAAARWSEEEVANLVLAIGIINTWNRIVITSRRQPPPLK
jgi:AhpD family alkylhydroperoxidase